MRASIIQAILLATLAMTSTAHAKLFGKKIKNPTKEYLRNLNDVYSGVKFSYFDKDDRLLIVEDFLKTVELEYVLLPLKKERINLDFSKLKENAIAAEQSVEDIILSSSDRSNEDLKEKITFLQAKSNMEFLDRMQKLVAEFKDTHFVTTQVAPF